MIIIKLKKLRLTFRKSCAKASLYFIPLLISMYSLDFVLNDFGVSSMHVNSVSTFI